MTKKNILHLFTKLPDKYNGKFIEFSEKNLSEYDHTYVALVSTNSVNEERNIDSTNILNLNDLNRIQKLRRLFQLFMSEKNQLVVFHGFSYTGIFLAVLAFMFKFTKLAEKSLWVTWGGDIYYFQNRPKTLAGYLNELLRKSIFKRLFFISSLISDESELIRLNYNTKAIQLDGFYPNPVEYEQTFPSKENEETKLSFMLGNSADPQNNHLDMLNALSHLKGTLKVYCVLSYGIVDTDYVNRVKSLGGELFGDDFIPLTNFMNLVDYKVLIESIDFACYYHNRQQAMGNIFQFLHMGKPVFIRRDTLSHQFLKNCGLNIEASEQLSEVTVDTLNAMKTSYAKVMLDTQKIIEQRFSDKAAQAEWHKMLERVFALLKK